MYDGEGSAYARCFYIGLKTAVSIGKNPKPGRDNVSEMVFFGLMWLMGIFVFAVLIGNNIIFAKSFTDKTFFLR